MSNELKVKTNNPIVYSIITNAIKAGKVSHAYLFSAPKNVEISDEPLWLIQELIGKDRSIESFPDLTTVDGSSSLIKKAQIIDATLVLQQSALDANGKKILFIKNVENTNKQSLNSLLKFVEEPMPNTYIIMTTNNISQVLSTIRSRAQVINLKAMPVLEIEKILVEANVPEKYSRVVASMAKSPQDGVDIYSGGFPAIYDKIVMAMKNSLKPTNSIITSLTKEITKRNYSLILRTLNTFLNDIWKKQQNIDISFKEEGDLLSEYAKTKFDFRKALMSINDFIIAQSSHVNFDLYKSKLLVELEECYE